MEEFIARFSSMNVEQLKAETRRILKYTREKSKSNTFDEEIKMKNKSKPIFDALIDEFTKRNIIQEYENIRRYVYR